MAKAPKIDPNRGYTIIIDYYGDDLGEIPAHAGELYDVEEIEWEGYPKPAGVTISFGAVGWELPDVLNVLLDGENFGEMIVVRDQETGETIIQDDWDVVRKIIGRAGR